ncbi:MAG: hypothetical protein QNJ63_16910 [Calothrix sp. MO_192.B10]|nr:hypothetical protein [Calothrix sp. MO_192.B10]
MAILYFGTVVSNTINCEGNIFWLSLKIFLLNNVCFSWHLLGFTSFHPTYEGLLRGIAHVCWGATAVDGKPLRWTVSHCGGRVPRHKASGATRRGSPA